MQTVQHRQSFYVTPYNTSWSRLTALTNHHQSIHVLTPSLTHKIQMVGHKLNQALVFILTTFVLGGKKKEKERKEKKEKKEKKCLHPMMNVAKIYSVNQA